MFKDLGEAEGGPFDAAALLATGSASTGDERACPLRSKQDNLALIHQKSRGWQPAGGEAQAAVMAVEARPVEARPVASRPAASKGPPSASPRSLNASF